MIPVTFMNRTSFNKVFENEIKDMYILSQNTECAKCENEKTNQFLVCIKKQTKLALYTILECFIIKNSEKPCLMKSKKGLSCV